MHLKSPEARLCLQQIYRPTTKKTFVCDWSFLHIYWQIFAQKVFLDLLWATSEKRMPNIFFLLHSTLFAYAINSSLIHVISTPQYIRYFMGTGKLSDTNAATLKDQDKINHKKPQEAGTG